MQGLRVEVVMHNKQCLKAVGIGSGLGGDHLGCAFGPTTLRASESFNQTCLNHGIELDWYPILSANVDLTPNTALQLLCSEAGNLSFELVQNESQFVFFSGDHSYAMGIWQGVMKALREKNKTLGLIWIDAHMDAHTFISSPSGNLHGMPLAALLGRADKLLKRIYASDAILPATNLALVGVRSFERSEQDLLSSLKVNTLYMKDILLASSLYDKLLETKAYLMEFADCFAISIDLDAVDPVDAPAVAISEPNGIPAAMLCDALTAFNGDADLVGIEISEYLPEFDKNNMTQNLIVKILSSIYG